jgi:hypothetical protein
MAESYRLAQAEMRRQLKRQWPDPPLDGPIALYLDLCGEARGDLDNYAGFLMDAAGPSKSQPGILWNDDRASVISSLLVEWRKVPKLDSTWRIHIALL